MPRHFRRKMTIRSPVVSYKHQREESSTYTGAAVNNLFLIYTGIGQGQPTTPQNIPTGSKVYSFDVSVNFVSADASTTGVFSWMIVKLRDSQAISDIAATDASSWSNIGITKMRNQVIYSHMGIFPTEDAGLSIKNVHIKVPKIYHRIREGDSMVLVFNAQSAGPLSIGTRYKSFS